MWRCSPMFLLTTLVSLSLSGASASGLITVEQEVAELRKQLTEVSALQGQLAEFERRLQSVEVERAEAEVVHRQLGALLENDIIASLDHMWLLLAGSLVVFMQAGFAMLEAGSCRAKNVQNVLMKNMSDVCLGTLCWFSFGWAFAFGSAEDNGFIGHHGFFATDFSHANSDGIQDGGLSEDPGATKQLTWFFQWAFCSAASTIVSGAVAERVMFPGYAIYTIAMTSFIYPVVVATTWGGGFLATMNDVGYMDFAGSGVVHMTGGVGALVGAIVVGPRTHRFEYPEEFHPHNLPLVVLGTFILWFGWYGFNVGSTLSMHSAETASLGAHVAMTTTISAATGGITVFVARWYVTRHKYDVAGMCNGVLAGLVSITAGCGNVETGSAFCIGLVGGLLYTVASFAMPKMGIDDPLDAFPVHGVCGAWGVLAAAFFDFGKGFNHVNGWNGWSCLTVSEEDPTCMEGVWVQLFAANVCEILFILFWVGVVSSLILVPLRLLGLLRCSDEVQDAGMDQVKHVPPKPYCWDDAFNGNWTETPSTIIT